jgi:cyclophilin family peptidyl-prolyl cis-trans isomerase
MTRLSQLLIAAALVLTPMTAGLRAQAPKPAAAGPILLVETVKGPIEIQLFPAEAPKTVDHIVALAKRNFYNGLRVHRVEPGYVVQFGDPQTRDMSKRDRWGSGGSFKPIGVAEFSAKHKHVVGAVALAHPGDAKLGDSQMYIMLRTEPKLDGKFTVFGQVISGMDVVRKLQEPDVIRRITVKS